MATKTELGSMEQLNETVTRLAVALDSSERRHASLVRILRWGFLAVIVLVAGMAYMGSDLIRKAYAESFKQQQAWVGQAKAQFEAMESFQQKMQPIIKDADSLYGILNGVFEGVAIVAMHESMSYYECAKEREKQSTETDQETDKALCYAKAAVEDLSQYLPEMPPLPPGFDGLPRAEQQKMMEEMFRQMMPDMMKSMMLAGGQVAVDTATLVHRLRRDSDFFRRTVREIGSTNKLLSGIGRELHLMNGMLRSIPPMAVEMNAMNRQIGVMTAEMGAITRQMSVMSYGVGSTMGRAGSMMPWNMAPW